MRQLWRGAAIATMDGASPWGWMADGALLAEDGRIVWVGPADAVPADARNDEVIDLHGGVLLPGLVDAHTHLVYGGDRAAEFERRLQGISYEQIAREGGGIRATVSATRSATDEDLLHGALRRARALRAEGVTTLEIKSGYGLTEADEARCLRVARAVGAATGQTVRTTALPAHALPPEYAGRADDYIDAVCTWLPRWQAEGLVDAVDAFCERIAFSPAQVERVFEVARALGLPVKLHAEQLSESGGAALAARFGALSADHLEWLSDEGIAAMAAAGTVAVLLPGAFHFLRETKLPPIERLRAAGVPIAVATDHNPGSSPTLSPLLMIHLACTLLRLTPEEAVAGMTREGARALGLADRGTLQPGQRADLAHFDIDHPRTLAYAFGQRPTCRTWVAGRETA
ncbi:imidazolonepropionase [Ideonella sp. 4Y16]|uniref:imidazolonepropionase n=1 Tax=Ideonella alba TaxID=2824118 RepID=UPI001B392EED|nr:imidazolonepropionase [Ideonella alba]MBQ0942098.1 imidazolonepropionase [Ideonella alba]